MRPFHNRHNRGNQQNPPQAQSQTTGFIKPPPKVPERRAIDLNTDFGQTRDKQFFEETEYQLLRWVSSVNIPCCVHDGEPKDVMAFIAQAKSFGCGIGAHIAYPNPANHGYEETHLSAEDLTAWLYVQLGAFQALAQANGLSIEHVRPHGALYKKMGTDPAIARLVAEVVYKINPWLFLVAPSGPVLEDVQKAVGIRVTPEIYLGKRYAASGLPAPNRFHENLNTQAILDQVRQATQNGTLTSLEGQPVKVPFNTLHVSPRLENAIELAEKLHMITGKPLSMAYSAVEATGWVTMV